MESRLVRDYDIKLGFAGAPRRRGDTRASSSLPRCIVYLLTGFRSGRMRRHRRMRRPHLPLSISDSVHAPLPVHFRIGHLEVCSESVVAHHARAKEQDVITKDNTVRVGHCEWCNDNSACWLRYRGLLYSGEPFPARSSVQMAKHVG